MYFIKLHSDPFFYFAPRDPEPDNFLSGILSAAASGFLLSSKEREKEKGMKSTEDIINTSQ